MKKLNLSILLLLLITNLGLAQQAIEKEVNETLWKSFVESWSRFDAKAFNNLHTDDVLRASGSGLTVGQAYKDRTAQSFARSIERKDKRMIHFWFEQRVYSGNTGYEVGYYKIVNSRPGEEERTYYARFHVVLRKENGQWKIAQDWDTGSVNGVRIDEKDWAKGTPLVF
ncbi:MAG: nuclear transport factor 2 family protein [Roseivirga sp.]|nr:nuclear transport factor 2 family protein [Roseivirga sp.]